MEHISTVMFSLFRGTPGHGEWVVHCLQEAWPAIVGQGIARACRPGAFEGSKLTIAVEDAAWGSALASVKDELLDKIRQATGGEVREISFFVFQ